MLKIFSKIVNKLVRRILIFIKNCDNLKIIKFFFFKNLFYNILFKKLLN